ncbi:MAG: hypothetical protein ABSF70_05400 [Terracidiphilus sp.]
MKIATRESNKHIAGGLVMLMLVLLDGPAAAPQQGIVGQQAQSIQSTENHPQDPNARTAIKGSGESPSGASYLEGSAPSTPPPPNQSAVASNSGRQEDSTQKPVGTAAAPYERTSGVAASKPAGAVIAPAKQRRARAILIRVGVVVGAGVAIGTVAALSHVSLSRPN